MLRVRAEDPGTPDAVALTEELSAALEGITGDSGKSSFDADDVRGAGALFAVARDADGRAVGCGAIRPLSAGVAELKRMYARPGNRGAGSAVLAFLEAQAAALEYRALWLSTRAVNVRAVGFYRARGYISIPNYGKYADRTDSVCFAKPL
ncbi:MAG TPA: GNAT family N-acetyltransferase [Telluria sp.]|nr:GNAT family N-acetyltransferase [Telluria sp.]